MAAMAILSNSCESNVTPSRKRKRKFIHFEESEQNQTAEAASCFTNAGFSSTPKKVLAKRRIQLKKNKENELKVTNLGLEVKSIAEIAKHHESKKIPQNPYEVLRKPPKKKRHTEGIVCFENPALNLDQPEKLFNPFEVVREATASKASNCFSNPALNLKVQDVSVLCNPFEVQREVSNQDLNKFQAKTEENTVLNPFKISPEINMLKEELKQKPCELKLGLPFAPKVGCRIDFKDISMSELTPSKLLAEKLVFSPVPKAKVSLGSIGEESSMDIGKELDRYQLELENSINEAKLRKTDVYRNDVLISPPDMNYQIQVVGAEKSKFAQKLCDISEECEYKQINEESTNQGELPIEGQEEKNIEEVKIFMAETNPFRDDLNEQCRKTDEADVLEVENLDELYGCSADDQADENSFSFKTPAPFIRAYTKSNAVCTKVTEGKESSTCNKSVKTGELDDHVKKSINVKNIIRKSVRKLVNIHHNGQQKQTEIKSDSMETREYEKSNGIMNVIRQSLRRKSARNLDEDHATKQSELSIVDCTERTMKLKSEVLQTEYVKIEDLTNEKKPNIRNSIRKSTRCVRNQFLRSVLNKKHEEYNLNK